MTVATAIVGRERIVFYQTTLAGIGLTALVGAVVGLRTARMLDIATLGTGIFLVFGRLGCFSVACCHGTLGRGVIYGPAHLAIGFWPRWSGRALWPVQLVEALASALLFIAALVVAREPGDAALIYIVGYTLVRFALELVRGDVLRPYVRGLSEAQWLSLVTALACAAWRPSLVTFAVLGLLLVAAAVLVATRRVRELTLPPHLHELDKLLINDGTRRQTSLGVAVSSHVLDDGRIDWVLSSQHPAWSVKTARRIAHALWPRFELVEGRTPGVVHVLTHPS